MLHTYEYRSQSVQHFSESENESASESGSEEQEPERVECRQLVPTQMRTANELRQCGSALVGTSCSPQPVLEDYFAHLTDQYSRALALEDHPSPMSSYPKPKQREEGNGGICHQIHYNTDRYIGYPQNNNVGHTYVAQEDRTVPVRFKPSTPKKGTIEHVYAYYESKLVDNGKVGHFRNNNNDLRYISQEDFTIPWSSRSKVNKGKTESVYAYDESEFDNHRHVGYGANYLQAGDSIPPSNSKPKLKKGKTGSGYAYEESESDNNQHVVYGSKEYYDMMYNGAKKSSSSTSSTTSNKRITNM